MTTDKKPVVIVGAGPVGLVIARRLLDSEIPFIVMEKSESLADDLRASTFHPPTLDMLAQLGLTSSLIARGLVSPTWQIRLQPSGERALFDLAVLAGDTDHPFRLQCPQSELCRILLDDLRARGADIRFGHEVIAARQDADTVTVTCRIGPEDTGAEKVFTASWLIGADGARSAVRKAMNVAMEGSTYPETTILATTQFPFEDNLEGLSNVNYVWHPGGTFSLLRLPDTWRCSVYADEGESIEEATTAASIARKLDAIVPGAGATGANEIRPYRIHRRIVGHYRKGRMVLAGDAAHLNSPSGGMGMNGGIHDAFELVDALAAIRDGASHDLLDRYEARRRPIAEAEILEQSHRNRTRMQERDPERRRAMLADLQAIAGDPVRAREHLLRSSMISGLRQAAAAA